MDMDGARLPLERVASSNVGIARWNVKPNGSSARQCYFSRRSSVVAKPPFSTCDAHGPAVSFEAASALDDDRASRSPRCVTSREEHSSAGIVLPCACTVTSSDRNISAIPTQERARLRVPGRNGDGTTIPQGGSGMTCDKRDAPAIVCRC